MSEENPPDAVSEDGPTDAADVGHESNLSALLSSAGLVFFGGVVGSLSKLLERVVIARTLDPSAYGEVSVGLAVMGFTVTLAMVGFTQGLPRFISRADTDEEIRGIWLTGLLLPGTLSVALVAVLLFGGGRVLVDALFESPDSETLLTLFVLAIPFVVGLEISIGAIRGQGNTIYRTYARDLFYPGVRLLALVALLAAGFGVVAAGAAYLVAAAGAFVLGHLLLHRLTPLVGEVELPVRELVAFSAPLIVASVITRLLTRTDTIVLSYFRSSQEVGLYNAAYPLANGMLIILASFGFLFLPLASRLDADDEHEEIDTIYAIVTKWVFIVTFPLFLTYVVFPGDVLSAVFGAEYRDASLAFVILAVGFLSHAAAGRTRETLSALGYTTYILVVNAVAFGLNVLLDFALIPVYGLDGAAVASAASFVLLNGIIVVVLKVKFSISPLSRWSTRTFVVLPAVMVPAAFLASRWVSLTLVTLPVALVAGGLATVVLTAVTGCLQPEDEIPLRLVEDAVGVRIPFVRRYIPDGHEE